MRIGRERLALDAENTKADDSSESLTVAGQPSCRVAGARLAAPLRVQSISGYMRSSYMTCHITGGFSLPEVARERSIQLLADDRIARGHLIGQILQM